jgi:predicted AAA+ superfamily ATPase
MDELQSHPSVGASWEGFVIEQVIASMPGDWRPFFYRTSAGSELDLLLLDSRGRTVGIEVKYSLSPAVGKGFWNAMADTSCGKGFIIYPGEESYPLGKNVVTMPARDVSRIWA